MSEMDEKLNRLLSLAAEEARANGWLSPMAAIKRHITACVSEGILVAPVQQLLDWLSIPPNRVFANSDGQLTFYWFAPRTIRDKTHSPGVFSVRVYAEEDDPDNGTFAIACLPGGQVRPIGAKKDLDDFEGAIRSRQGLVGPGIV